MADMSASDYSHAARESLDRAETLIENVERLTADQQLTYNGGNSPAARIDVDAVINITTN